MNAPSNPMTTKIAMLTSGEAPRLTRAYNPNVNPSGNKQGFLERQ